MANGKRTSVVLDMIQHQMDKDEEDRDLERYDWRNRARNQVSDGRMANDKRTSVVLDTIQHQMDKDENDRDLERYDQRNHTGNQVSNGAWAIWQMVSVPQWY